MTYVYRASELGACIKAQVARRLEYTPLPTPPKMQEIFDRGNTHEEECVAAMFQHGYAIFEQQYEVNIPVGRSMVRGHLDGIVEEYGILSDRVLEIKSPGAWAKFERAYKTNDWSDNLAFRYAWQISIYMHALKKEALIACLDNSEIRTFVIEIAPFSILDIEERVTQIERLAADNTLPKICSSNDYPCPFAYLHEEPELEDDTILDELVFRYDMEIEAERIAKARKDELRIEIMQHMDGRAKVETATSKVTVYEQAGSSRISEDLLKAAGINPEDYKVKGASSTRIRITPKERT